MSNRAGRNGAALSLLIVSTLVMGGLFAALIASGPVARAGTCDQVGGVITGDWTITNTQVCSGIIYTVDGTVTIDAGGSLTLENGGLRFSKDASHAGYALNVNAGGELILDNSIVTTQTEAIAPYLNLAFTVSGLNSRFAMRDGSILKFPGWFNATSATMNITDSRITGFIDAELAGLGLDVDNHDDAPRMAWSSSSVSFFRSRIERIYEYSGGTAGTIALAGSNLYAYDSYLGVDFSSDALTPGEHNTLVVDGFSNAYLYNVTIDRSEDPESMADWQSAYVPTAAGGSVHLLRWFRARIVDSSNIPADGATIWSVLSPSSTTAQYPDNGLSSTPSSQTLWYIGRTPGGLTAWNRTGSNGRATIPLYTDQITVASLPNAESFGNYHATVSYAASTTLGSVQFPPYPAVTEADNSRAITISFSDVQVDLELRQTDYPGTLSVPHNQAFIVYVLIHNVGQTAANGVSVAAYLNGNRAMEVGRRTGLSVSPFSVVNQSMSINAISLAGSQRIEIVVDPDDVIFEGSAARESNNFANISLEVQSPGGTLFITAPTANQAVEPGRPMIVNGYVRDQSTNPIVGLPLRIELRSGATLIDSNNTVSQSLGFYEGTIDVPSDLADGTYTLSVTPGSGPIAPATSPVAVRRATSILYQPVPILGIPFWFFFIILAVAAAAAIGITMYIKVYGLGKMVECGECGAFINQDATSCPKCGVEFEKDMAKCSNCQAWIPVDVKQCPECGVEFATGQVEMADYQEKMRLQYDEVVAKFKEEASRQLGRSLSDREFQEWWRKQPTFLTFEDWLREEEEMRKMGSKPCPTCGTLNSVTATVCHKCGSLMRETPRPPSGGGGGGAPPVVQSRRAGAPAPPESPAGGQASPYAPPGGQPLMPSGTETIPRRVIRKPITPQPLVQKKVIKKPTGEGQEGTSQTDTGGGDNPTDDEL